MPAQETRIATVVIPAVTLVALVTLWELAVRLFDINPLIFPSPIEVWQAFRQDSTELFMETAITMTEAVLGFLIGSISAYILAIMFVHAKLIQDALYPYAIALKSTPLIAIAPLLVLWFGNGMLSKVVMSALVAFFPVLVNAVNGLRSVDAELLDLMKSLSATRRQVLMKIRIPNSLGYLFASLKIASSLAVVGAVIGEFTGATEGIGHYIVTSSYYLETARMFAGIIMISLGGILFFGFVAWLERRVVFWQEQE